MRRKTYTPRVPGVALQSRTPVRSRYAEYSSARDAGVAPCQILAIGVPRSEPIEFGDRALIMNVSRVQGRFGLEQQDMRLFVGDREVLDAMRDDRKLPRSEYELFVLQFESQPALHDEKELVFQVVMMPHERALQLGELDEAVIHLANDLRAPLVLKSSEHFSQIDFADRHVEASGSGSPGGVASAKPADNSRAPPAPSLRRSLCEN